MKEIYKNIENTNYSISNKGNLKYLGHTIVYKCGKKVIIQPYNIELNKHSQGYLCVLIKDINGLSIEGYSRPTYIHRLVAKAFKPNPNNLPIVNHIDGDKQNNNDWNLEWVTTAENVAHAWKIGLITYNNRFSILKENHIPLINKLIDKGLDYKEIENKLGLYKNQLTKRKTNNPNHPLIKQIKEDKNGRILKNANQEFINKINDLIDKGLNDIEIEQKLQMYKNCIADIRRRPKFKNFNIKPANRYQKLNHETCLEILKDHENGMKIKELVSKYNIHSSMIYRIKERKDFKNVPTK
jgi:hypothetical protein